jgi:hypothetical protein
VDSGSKDHGVKDADLLFDKQEQQMRLIGIDPNSHLISHLKGILITKNPYSCLQNVHNMPENLLSVKALNRSNQGGAVLMPDNQNLYINGARLKLHNKHGIPAVNLDVVIPSKQSSQWKRNQRRQRNLRVHHLKSRRSNNKVKKRRKKIAQKLKRQKKKILRRSKMFAQTEPTFDFYKNNSYKYLHFSELQQLTGKIFDYDGMASSFNYQMLPYLTAQINIFWYVFINMNVYINPPFSNIANVLKFAYDSGHIGSSFTVVVPVKPEQDWFYRYRPPEDQIILRHKKGDIVFEDSIRGLKLPCTFDVEVWRIDSATKPVGLSIPVKLINAIPRSFDDWHKILHICGDYMKKLKKSTYDFTVKGKDTLTTPCDVCLKARKSTPSIPTDPHAVRVTTPETEFGVDWVPFSTTGYNGETGAFIYFDLASGRIHSFPAKTKSASTKSLLWIIAKTSKVPSKIHFDDDVIFTEGDYMDTLLIFGIGHKISPAFRHEFNAAEGPIGHLRVGVRTLLFQGKMPPMFWPQSLAQYANIRNYTFY